MWGLVSEFWRWWAGQLADLVLGARRGAGSGRRAALVLTPDDDPASASLTARIDRRGRVERLGIVAADSHGLRELKQLLGKAGALTTQIELPDGAILEKRLTLPLTAERDLDGVIGYEIERETPFTPDEIYWSSTVERRDRAQRRLTVRLAMAAKAPIADLVTELSRAGLAPRALTGPGEDGVVTTIPVHHDTARSGRMARAVPIAVASCAVLGAAAVAIPFVRQSRALDAVEERIQMLQPGVAAVEHLQQRRDRDREQGERLAAQRAEFGNPLILLEAVTAAVPDDTYLTELDYAGGKIVLTGLSKAASHLIADLSRSSALKDPAFSAPVRRLDQTGLDMFSITATERR